MEDLTLLLDPSVSAEGAVLLDLPAAVSLEQAADALEALLAAEPVDIILLVVDGQPAGTTSRDYLTRLGETERGVGDGAGATLPGESLRYRILRFACPSCDAIARRIHVDPRDPPVCPNEHGPMRLQR